MINKSRFVSRLGILLEDVDRLDIYLFTYEKSESGDEYVIMKFKNGYEKRVNITGDSELGIIQDVIKHLD